MDEYILTVIVDGHEEEIKSYGDSIELVVDSIVKIESITKIVKAVRLEDKVSWSFEGMDLEELRKLRLGINNEAAVIQELATYNKV